MQQVVAEHPVFIAAVSMCRAIVSVTVDTIDTIVSVTVTDSASIDQSLFYELQAGSSVHAAAASCCRTLCVRCSCQHVLPQHRPVTVPVSCWQLSVSAAAALTIRWPVTCRHSNRQHKHRALPSQPFPKQSAKPRAASCKRL